MEGEVTLLFDLPGGMETTYGLLDPPDVSRILKVRGIWAVTIPERFIERREGVVSFARYPSVLHPGEYGPDAKVPIQSMSDPRFDQRWWGFYLVETDDLGPAQAT